jgi:hypothetical protein
MPIMRKLAALGLAAEAARRFATKNPDKAREITDKAASFVDQRTKGKYSSQIGSAKRRLADYVGYGSPDVVTGTVVTPTSTHGFGAPNPPNSASTDATPPTPPTPYKRS